MYAHVMSKERRGVSAPRVAGKSLRSAALLLLLLAVSIAVNGIASRFDFWPVRTAEPRSAVVGLAFDPDERPQSPDVPVQIVADVLALALDRRRARDQALAR